MVVAARLFDWKEALLSVRPETFTAWHRQGFVLAVEIPANRQTTDPKDLRQLILTLARDNPTWGQARIAAELSLKLGIQVSPRTVQKYLLEDPKAGRRQSAPSQRWMTFVGNQAKAMLACDCFVPVTVNFRAIYVFILMEVGSRPLVHFQVTSHPTAAWTSHVLVGSKLGTRLIRYLSRNPTRSIGLFDRERIFAHHTCTSHSVSTKLWFWRRAGRTDPLIARG